MRALLMLCACLVVCPLAVAQPRPDLSPAEIREDIESFREGIKARHVEPFRFWDETAFDTALDSLAAEAESLDFMELATGLARVAAQLKEGHTGVMLAYDRRLALPVLPIELLPVRDGLTVVAATPDHTDLIGARVLAIGDADQERLTATLAPLASVDTPTAIPLAVANLARVPAILEALGLATDSEGAHTIRLETNSHPFVIRLESVDRFSRGEESPQWTVARSGVETPLWIARRDDPWWHTLLQDGRTLYFQFNSADTGASDEWNDAAFDAYVTELMQLVRSTPALDKLVVDLRWNSGGSIADTRQLPIELLRTGRFGEAGELFVLTGPQTFSAAVYHLDQLEEFFQPIIVGTPNAGRPGHEAELGRFYLPNSGLEVRVSTLNAHHSDEHRPRYFVDLEVILSSADIREGRDPVLQAALDFDPSLSVAAELAEAYTSRGIEAALEHYRELRSRQADRYVFETTTLYRFGVQLLLQHGDAEAALAAFELNLDEQPWSPSAYDALGYVCEQLGRAQEAIGYYRQAVLMDRRFGGRLNNIAELEAGLDATRTDR